jgi:hypothetical protein
MTKLIVEAPFLDKLQNLTQPVELCDGSGRVLGRFTPVGDAANTGRPEPQLSEEELQRREQGPDYSTEEVLAHLEKL